jgi:hypothetical protein
VVSKDDWTKEFGKNKLEDVKEAFQSYLPSKQVVESFCHHIHIPIKCRIHQLGLWSVRLSEDEIIQII